MLIEARFTGEHLIDKLAISVFYRDYPLNLVGYLPRSNFFFIIEARIGAEASVFGDALWFTRCRFGLVLRGRWPAGRALPVGEMFVPAPEVSVADNDACGLSLNAIPFNERSYARQSVV